MKQCIMSSLSTKLNLPWFNNKEKEEIVSIVFSYILGLLSYANLCQNTKILGVHKDVSFWLRSLDKDNVQYIMNLRKYLKGRYGGFAYSKDKKYIKKLGFNFDKIKPLKRYPSETAILESVAPFITNVLGKNTYYDVSFSREDVCNELQFKASQTYRIYIFGYGTFLNKLSFYSCIYQSIRNRNIDMAISSNRKGKFKMLSLNESIL